MQSLPEGWGSIEVEEEKKPKKPRFVRIMGRALAALGLAAITTGVIGDATEQPWAPTNLIGSDRQKFSSKVIPNSPETAAILQDAIPPNGKAIVTLEITSNSRDLRGLYSLVEPLYQQLKQMKDSRADAFNEHEAIEELIKGYPKKIREVLREIFQRALAANAERITLVIEEKRGEIEGDEQTSNKFQPGGYATYEVTVYKPPPYAKMGRREDGSWGYVMPQDGTPSAVAGETRSSAQVDAQQHPNWGSLSPEEQQQLVATWEGVRSLPLGEKNFKNETWESLLGWLMLMMKRLNMSNDQIARLADEIALIEIVTPESQARSADQNQWVIRFVDSRLGDQGDLTMEKIRAYLSTGNPDDVSGFLEDMPGLPHEGTMFVYMFEPTAAVSSPVESVDGPSDGLPSAENSKTPTSAGFSVLSFEEAEQNENLPAAAKEYLKRQRIDQRSGDVHGVLYEPDGNKLNDTIYNRGKYLYDIYLALRSERVATYEEFVTATQYVVTELTSRELAYLFELVRPADVPGMTHVESPEDVNFEQIVAYVKMLIEESDDGTIALTDVFIDGAHDGVAGGTVVLHYDRSGNRAVQTPKPASEVVTEVSEVTKWPELDPNPYVLTADQARAEGYPTSAEDLGTSGELALVVVSTSQEEARSILVQAKEFVSKVAMVSDETGWSPGGMDLETVTSYIRGKAESLYWSQDLINFLCEYFGIPPFDATPKPPSDNPALDYVSDAPYPAARRAALEMIKAGLANRDGATRYWPYGDHADSIWIVTPSPRQENPQP